MRSLSQILAALGFGMARIDVRVDRAIHPRGTEVTGTVEVTGGIAAQTIRALSVKLEEFWYNGNSTQSRSLAEIVVADGLKIVPRGKHSFPFRLRVPDKVLISKAGLFSSAAGGRLVACAEIDRAMNPRRSVELTISLHREVQALFAGMQALGFTECGAGFTITVKAPPPGQTVSHYHPPNRLSDQLEGAVLVAQVDGGKTTGELNLNLRETTLRDKMKALMVTQYHSLPLSIEPGVLLMPDGQPSLEAARQVLRELLEEALVLPDNEKNRLLRPTTAPVEVSLLHPVEGGDRTSPNELLRPVEVDAEA
jgi:hypothetical protein